MIAKHVEPTYGAKIQYSIEEITEPRLPDNDIKYIQRAVGIFLCYAFALDNTLLVALSDLGSEQTKATKKTLESLIKCDEPYLSALRARSRAAGFYFLSNQPVQPSQAKINGAIFVLCKILKNMMGLAVEVEIASTYLNAKEAIPIRNTLIKLDHPQPQTQIQVDNTITVRFSNNEIK